MSICVSTVIDYVDASIECGFLRASAILVPCRRDSGKTILSKQFIHDIAIHDNIVTKEKGSAGG